MKKIKNLMMFIALGAAFASCEKENLEQPITDSNANLSKFASELILNPNTGKSAALETSENMGVPMRNAVEPSQCGPTQFRDVQRFYINQIIADPIALFEAQDGFYGLINRYYSWFLNDVPQYFGAEGKYTSLMVKRQRELESFWNMPFEIKVNGQHTANLNNRAVWEETLTTFFGYRLEDGSFRYLSAEEAGEIADYYLTLNEQSTNLPENPYFATDGFASSNRTIVIGDGLVQWLAEAGVEEGIVWSGILAHEWAHQIQFLNYPTWYPNGADPDAATATRYTELEADFLAAYYMTHKRGATYNQKRVEDFYDLFFLIGDCGFESPGHHGTPLQRERAADLGYALSNQAQKQGQILTQQEAHEYFVANVNTLFTK